jgi:hypothetical protein
MIPRDELELVVPLPIVAVLAVHAQRDHGCVCVTKMSKQPLPSSASGATVCLEAPDSAQNAGDALVVKLASLLMKLSSVTSKPRDPRAALSSRPSFPFSQLSLTFTSDQESDNVSATLSGANSRNAGCLGARCGEAVNGGQATLRSGNERRESKSLECKEVKR